MNLDFRLAVPGDSEWLFDTYRRTMKGFVTSAYGWDDDLQQAGFAKKPSPRHLSNSYVGRQPMRVCALGRRTGSRMAEDVLYRAGDAKQVDRQCIDCQGHVVVQLLTKTAVPECLHMNRAAYD